MDSAIFKAAFVDTAEWLIGALEGKGAWGMLALAPLFVAFSVWIIKWLIGQLPKG